MNQITQDLVQALFSYRDGNLYWKVKRQGIKINNLAGSIHSHGYRHIKVNGKIYKAHRLIFLYHHGYLPKYIDHIDGNKLNNNIGNLRSITNSQNLLNSKKRKLYNGKPTTSQYKGISWNKRDKKWIAEIMINYESKYLGSFNLEEDAAIAYNKAAIELFGEYAKLNEVK